MGWSLKSFAVVWLVAVALTCSVKAANTAETVGENEAFTVDAKAGSSRQDELSYPGASYIAVHFSKFNIPEGDVVVVRSPDSTISYEYTGLGRGDSGLSGGFHAASIAGDRAVVEYRASNAASGADWGYSIDGFVHGVPTDQRETVCGTDNTLPAKCYLSGNMTKQLPEAYKRSKAVARLLINGASMCTGWLVGSEGHLLTNHHCITEAKDAAKVEVEFMAESPDCENKCNKRMGCKGQVVAQTTTFVQNHKEHDWAIIKLPNTVDLSQYGYLQLRATGPKVGEQVYIPQHPSGYAKRIASVLDDGSPAVITKLDVQNSCGANQVGYMADTEGGSSGSPVISANDHTVVALHHCGGCENTAVNVELLLADFKASGITIKDLVATGGSSPATPPASPAANATTPAASTPATSPKPTQPNSAVTTSPKPTQPNSAVTTSPKPTQPNSAVTTSPKPTQPNPNAPTLATSPKPATPTPTAEQAPAQSPKPTPKPTPKPIHGRDPTVMPPIDDSVDDAANTFCSEFTKRACHKHGRVCEWDSTTQLCNVRWTFN